MKNSVQTLLICSLLLVLASCKPKSYNEILIHQITHEMQNEIKTYHYIFIIPNSGCTGCISDAERFFKENFKNKKIKFIFTNIFSEKDFKIRLGRERLQGMNILVDTNNLFYYPEYKESIYPIVIKIKENKLVNIKYFNGDLN